MDNKIEDYLTILQEECAEVIQAISKIKRFGEYSKNPYIENSKNNKVTLNEEIGDLLAMVDIIIQESDLLNIELINNAKEKKKNKVPKWIKGGADWQKAVEIHHNGEKNERTSI